jgi:hypothetical protein
MKKTKLSSSEIHDLITRYKSELKKLEFQSSEINLTISQLESRLKNIKGSEKVARTKTKKRKTASVKVLLTTAKKKRGRPAKKATSVKKAIKAKHPIKAKALTKTAQLKKAVTTKKIAKQKKIKTKPQKVSPKAKKVLKSDTKKGYKLTFWDEYVIESIKQAGKVRITHEILQFVTEKMKATGKSASDTEIQNKVIRSLQKLANRRNDLKKVPYEGKGLAYALPAWFGENGKLNKEFKR